MIETLPVLVKMNSSNLVSVRRCSADSSNCRFDFATCGYMPTWPSSNHKNEDNNGVGGGNGD
jgi:hypothetical protein